jgi:hypothetical protein
MTDHAKQNAALWLETIVAGMDGLARLQMLLRTGEAQAVPFDGDTFDDADTLSERLQEMPLSVQVRGGWHNAGDDDAAREAVEYEILLSTGGPALRIVGDLGDYSNPTNARLQYQDWGTPWTDYHDMTEAQGEHVEAFAGLFYFGD